MKPLLWRTPKKDIGGHFQIESDTEQFYDVCGFGEHWTWSDGKEFHTCTSLQLAMQQCEEDYNR